MTGAPAMPRGPRIRAAELRLEGVSHWYGDVMALNGVDLVFGPGVTGLLGPNGAGKSTLVRLVTGMAAPVEGVITLDGDPVRNGLAALARIGYVADGDGLYDEQSARRFLADQARLRGFPAAVANERAAEVLQRVGLAEAASRRVGSFSKGMRQRLKLAQALLHEPDLVVLDEPLTGLDPAMRRDFIGVIRELGEGGATVVVSSHVLHEIEAMTDTIVLMHHGQVLAEGTVDHIRDLLEKHARRFRIVSPGPRRLACDLLAHEDVVTAVSVGDGHVDVETPGPDRLCRLVQRLAAAEEHSVSALESLDADLSSVFLYLVSG